MLVRLSIVLLIFYFILSGCLEKKDVSKNTKDIQKYQIDSLSKEVLQIFSITGYEHEFDSTSLCFYCCKNYDTTYLIEIKKNNLTISCKYYQILPEYHRFIFDYASETSKLIFFEGCSFALDSTEWQTIVRRAEVILSKKIPQKDNSKITDGVLYGLLYNSQIQRGRTGDPIFRDFELFLKSGILLKCYNSKRHLMTKQK